MPEQAVGIAGEVLTGTLKFLPRTDFSAVYKEKNPPKDGFNFMVKGEGFAAIPHFDCGTCFLLRC